ncbi:MAG: hypothetical protein WC554_11805 [Clostridia bacterium]|jgi:hypothetical protein
MKLKESTRIRENGTSVTMPEQLPDPPEARIGALRQIVNDCQYAKIDGIMVDLFTANTIVQIYNALNDANKAKYSRLPVYRMADIAFKLASK